jgi:two-component system chemotaxis sensor kinase CheA
VFVGLGHEEYGIPIKVVEEIGSMNTVTDLEDGTRETTDGRRKDLIDLSEALGTPEPTRSNGDGMLVTVEDGVRPAAIRCDEVRGQQEVVVKPFEGLLKDIPGLSGAAVMGEGDVVNILDVESL